MNAPDAEREGFAELSFLVSAFQVSTMIQVAVALGIADSFTMVRSPQRNWSLTVVRMPIWSCVFVGRSAPSASSRSIPRTW